MARKYKIFLRDGDVIIASRMLDQGEKYMVFYEPYQEWIETYKYRIDETIQE